VSSVIFWWKKKRDLNMLSDIMMDICRVYIKRISKNPIRHLFLVGWIYPIYCCRKNFFIKKNDINLGVSFFAYINSLIPFIDWIIFLFANANDISSQYVCIFCKKIKRLILYRQWLNDDGMVSIHSTFFFSRKRNMSRMQSIHPSNISISDKSPAV